MLGEDGLVLVLVGPPADRGTVRVLRCGSNVGAGYPCERRRQPEAE